ncbi:MAG: CBS domain-containing protein [Chloroflexi bacterium]|nr:CBS domain-containing protein [Chloroflexota bacterium]
MFSLADERQRRLVLDSLWLGVVGAVAAQIFMLLLDLAQDLLLQGIAGYRPPGLPNEGGQLIEIVGSSKLWLIPLVTTLGGLISGVLVYSIAPEAEGHGTDSAVKAVHRARGLIRARIPPLKMVASAITIGAGGSAGREGPTALIAAGIGSVYATVRRRSDEERRMLVLIGMSAGLSAIFRTPIGAAIFAIEVLYSDMEFETTALLYTLLASVVAYSINGAIDGWEPLFDIPANLGVEHAADYLEYAALGIAGGLVAALLPVVFYKSRDFFHALRVPNHIKPAIGGLGVGLMALALPEVLGGGYGWIQLAMNGEMATDVLFVLIFAKILAMSLTVGSGGSGGVFAPSLFVGAMLGGVLADVFNQNPAAFVLVGMAAVFSGAGRVPIATLFMVTEMTGGYHLLAAAALVVTLSYLVQVTLAPLSKYTSLYEAQIPQRGPRDVDLLEGVTAADAMTQDFDSVPASMPVRDLIDEFERTHHHGFTVVDEAGKLYGIVTLGDLDRAMLDEQLEDRTVADIATVEGLAVGYPDETMGSILWRMAVRGVGRLPIVDRDDPHRLRGVVRREDIVHAYERAMERRVHTSYRLKELREAHEGNVRVLEVDISRAHAFVEKPVAEIAPSLPSECILVSIRRDKKLLIPRGSTIVREGDHLVVMCSPTSVDEARRAFGLSGEA